MKKQAIIEHLKQFVTSNKKEKMAAVMPHRTRHITIVLEDIYHPSNANAIVRSAECFGLQDIHIVEQGNTFQANTGIARGASKWLTMPRYKNASDSIAAVKKQGYRVVATTPHADAQYLHELSLDTKVALMFGTEDTGLSNTALDHADAFVKIPMFGFTESFNVSVSVAICLYHLTTKLRNSSIAWQLTEQEQQDVLLMWLRNTLPHSDALERKLLT